MSELNRRTFFRLTAAAVAVTAIGIPVEKRRPRFLIEDYFDKQPQTWVEFRLHSRDHFRLSERFPVDMKVNGLPVYNLNRVGNYLVTEPAERVYTVLGRGNEDLWWRVDDVHVSPGDTLSLEPGDLCVSVA